MVKLVNKSQTCHNRSKPVKERSNSGQKLTVQVVQQAVQSAKDDARLYSQQMMMSGLEENRTTNYTGCTTAITKYNTLIQSTTGCTMMMSSQEICTASLYGH